MSTSQYVSLSREMIMYHQDTKGGKDTQME